MGNIFKYTFKYKGLFTLRLLFTVVKSLVGVGLAAFLGNIIDVFTEGRVELFPKMLISCALFIIIEVIIFFVDGIVSAKYTEKTVDNIRVDIFNNIMRKDISDFSSNNTGSYLSILSNDILIIKTDFIDSLFSLIFQVLSFISTLILMLSISVPVTLIILFMAFLNFFSTALLSNKIVKEKGNYSEKLEQVTKIAKEIFSGFEVVKNFNIMGKMRRIYHYQSRLVEEKRALCLILMNIVDIISVVWGSITYLMVLLICGFGVYKGTMTVGTVIIVTQLINSVTSPIGQIIYLVNSILSVKEIAHKISSIVENEEVDTDTKKVRVQNPKEIIIDNLNFSYESKKNVLNNVNFKFEQGKKYAIVGRSGSGKSTLIKLIMRYYKEYTGQILLNGADIRDISKENFYNLFSIIEQKVFMFDGTIKQNICLYNKYPKRKVFEVVKKCGLLDVINNLEDGINTKIGESGDLLSGGEKQRISIARALLRETPIMILDEFTSSLDNETSSMIENLLLDIPEITLISITHKLIKSVLNKYDEIIVMKDGCIVEHGSFDELIEKKSHFYNLYYIQEDR